MLSANFRKALTVLLLVGLIILPRNLVFAQSTNSTEVGFFETYKISPNTNIEVPIEIKNVSGLYAFDISMKFDPAVLQATDADASQTGIQASLGKFMDGGLVLYNTVDNVNGTIHFVITQTNPSEPKSGDGVLFVVYFKAVKQGESPLSLTNVQLSTRDGVEITSTSTDSTVDVDVSVPTAAVTATSIPVQDSSSLVMVPTMAATNTPTEIPTATVTPVPTAAESTLAPKSADTALPIAETGQQSSLFQRAQLFLVTHWWIVMVLAVLVIILAIYLVVSLKKSKDDEEQE